MVNLFGGDSLRSLVFGFMVASAALSMWVSNTATTLMLLPVAYAVLDSMKYSDDRRKLAVPLFLGIAYAASIGGLGTPIGSPPNVIFLKVYAERGTLVWPGLLQKSISTCLLTMNKEIISKTPQEQTLSV